MSVGRGVYWKKTQVEECKKLDILSITRKCDLETAVSGTSSWKNSSGGRSEVSILFYAPEKIQLSYTITKKQDDEKKYFDYYVYLDVTSCNYGGKRWWFKCPNCWRRCRILYLPPGGIYFACRLCLNLTYQSQQVGTPMGKLLEDFIFDYPKWDAEYWQTKSKKRKKQLMKKMRRVYNRIPDMVAYNKKQLKK